MIDSKKFNFNFFLGGMTKVTSLVEGARLYGGATKFKNEIISNIPTDDFIRITEDNEISIFVPSTLNVSEQTDNTKYVKAVIDMLVAKYPIYNLTFYNTEGSWYSEEQQKVVIENITIITARLKEVTEDDINYFIDVANYLKQEMNQEGVSLSINSALAIV